MILYYFVEFAGSFANIALLLLFIGRLFPKKEPVSKWFYVYVDVYKRQMIGHDPHELAAFLSAVLQGYTQQSAQAELARVFGRTALSA